MPALRLLRVLSVSVLLVSACSDPSGGPDAVSGGPSDNPEVPGGGVDRQLEDAERALRRALRDGGDGAQAYWRMAGAYLGRGQPARAIETYDKALALGYQGPDSDLELGQALFEAGDYQRLLVELPPLGIGSAQRRERIAVLRGRAQAALGNWPAARTALQAALDLAPQDTAAVAAMVELYLRFGELEAASALVEGWLQTSPGDPVALRMTGELRHRGADYPGAVEAYSAAASADPTNPLTQLGLAWSLLAQGQLQRLPELVDLALQADPEQPLAVLMAAVVDIQQHRFNAAQQKLDQVAKWRQEDPRVPLLRAVTAFAVGDYGAVEARLQQYSNATPKAFGLSAALLRHAAFVAAERALLPESQLDPLTGLTHSEQLLLETIAGPELARAGALDRAPGEADARPDGTGIGRRQEAVFDALRLGNGRRAVGLARGLAEGLPATAESWSTLAAVHRLLDQQDLALAAYRRAAELAPADPGAQAGLATSLFVNGDSDAADRLFAAILTRWPGNAAALRGRLQVAMEAGDAAQAEHWLRVRLARAPDDPGAGLALVGQLLGRPEKAADAVTEARRLEVRHPDDPVLLEAMVAALRAAGDQQQADQTSRRAVLAAGRQPMSFYRVPLLTEDTDRVFAVDYGRRMAAETTRNAALVDAYGRLLIASGDPLPGIEYLRRAHDLRPLDRSIEYHLAVGLLGAGKPIAARRQLSELLDKPGTFAEQANAWSLAARLDRVGGDSRLPMVGAGGEP